MIESVEIQNFKNIRNQRIELEPLTVFVGANGSGKTSVLEAIYLALSNASGLPSDDSAIESNWDWLHSRGAEGGLSIACKTQIGEVIIKPNPIGGMKPPPDLPGNRVWNVERRIGMTPQDAIALSRSIVWICIHSAQLMKASYTDRNPPRMESDGEGLASVLAYVALNDPDAFQQIVAYTRSLIPQLKRIRFQKAAIERVEADSLRVGDELVDRRVRRTYPGETMLFDFEGAENVFAQTVSSGTLILVGLLTVLLGPSHPRILLMDDIEQGLHPLAQKSLLEVLRQVMGKFLDLQILATTHSPYLLDDLRPEEIRLMTINEDGSSVCGRLDEHPQFGKWKDEMAPGELWSLFGEKWLVQGGAAR
jgi:predicted ATPase